MPLPEHTVTLNDLLSQKEEWTEDDITQIINGLRLQREQWNTEQAQGSRKRTPSKNIPVGEELKLGKKSAAKAGKPAPSKLHSALAGLKL